MLAHQKKLLLLKEQNLKSLPSDVTGHLYREFDAFNIENSVKYAVHSWLRDVGIAKSPDEKLILFMSHGGTCRCAMAKIILRQALRRRNLPFKMRVESVARWYGSSDSASHGAIKAIKNAYGEDLLCDHRVTRICPGYLRDADLILTMEKDLAEGIQCEHLPKIQTFNRFFRDSEEDLLDPWPDDVPEAPAKYKACLEDIRSAIVPNVDRITRFLAS
jgi:protein-tyrosine-phosphatase